MTQKTPHSTLKEGLISLALFALLILVLYPELCIMLSYVMGHMTWELHDPAVSNIAFVPGFRTLHYEWFRNHNLLWSSLRGMGYPLLGNEVQVAPLFPLTLLWSWVPEPYYWNLVFISRLLLLGWGSYWVGRKVLALQKWGAFLFSFNFAFAVYVLRWANHPWQNGLLAGMAYLFFLHHAIKTSSLSFQFKRGLNFLGLIVAVYSLVTCGFPESALMAGILSFLVLIPFWWSSYRSKELKVGAYLWDFAWAHMIAFLIASPQIFGLVDLMGDHPLGYRNGTGQNQYTSWKILIPMLSRLTDDRPSDGAWAIHFFNLIPCFFFLHGIVRLVRSKKLLAPDLGAIFCLVFWVIKCFPVWPWFNQFFGSLPIAGSTWFIIYFLSMPIFFFAYFSGCGADYLAGVATSGRQLDREISARSSRIIGVVILGALLYCASKISGASAFRALKIVYLFVGLLLIIQFLFKKESSRRNAAWIVVFSSAFLILELVSVRMVRFMPLNSGEYQEWFSHQRPQELKGLLEKNGILPFETREDYSSGDYTSVGIGSLNSPGAIIPERLNQFYDRIFITMPGWHGYMPIQKARFTYSWGLASVNLHLGLPLGNRLEKGESERYQLLGTVSGMRVYFDPNALPRAYLAKRCLWANDGIQVLNSLSDSTKFSLGEAILEGKTSTEVEKILCQQTQRSNFEKVKILNDEGAFLTMKARGPGILVLNDNYAKGWQAKDEHTGVVLPIYNANFIFRAVLLTENKEYDIRWSYEPHWLSWAHYCVLIGLGLAGLFILVALLPYGLKWYHADSPKVSYEY